MLVVVSLVLLLTAQRQGAKPSSAVPPFVYEYGSSFSHFVDEPKGRSYSVQSKFRPFYVEPLNGPQFKWRDVASGTGGSFVVDGSVRNGVAIIHYVGTMASNSDDEKNDQQYIGYYGTLQTIALNNVAHVDAEASITGTISCQCTKSTSPNSGAGARITINDGIGDLEFHTSDDSKAPTSASKSISYTRRYSCKSDVHTGMLSQVLDPPGIYSSLFPVPEQYKAQGYQFEPLRFASGMTLSTGATKASATAHCDITMIIRLSANSKPLPISPALPRPDGSSEPSKPDDLPSTVTLSKSTTKDAKSVTVDYEVAGGAPVGAISFNVYRSKNKDVNPASDDGLLGTESAKTVDLAPGAHEVTLLRAKDLPPDPDRPYVVVVATANGKTSQTYFRKWRLATVAHGYAGLFHDDRVKTRAWTQKMANDLQSIDHFDKAIALDWVSNSVKAQAGMTALAGDDLANQIMAYRKSKASQHPGDVVDVHLIGHSRGTVVTGRALVALANAGPAGSYVQVTLLDIHPANKDSDDLASYSVLAQAGQKVYPDFLFSNKKDVLAFQARANDPEVTIPANVGVRSVEVWSQHTNCVNLNWPEDFINLWGQSKTDNRVVNHSGVEIEWQDLTASASIPFPAPAARSMGHDEVHQYYQDQFVSTGKVR